MTEFVSILIPCFNAERWVAQAIESALAQTHQKREVIVVDDGSEDGSLDVVRRYDGRIRWETGSHRGGNVARNRLLQLASGEWLQYLDADDWLEPGKVKDQKEFLDSHRDTDVIYGPSISEHWSESEVRRETVLIPEPHDPWTLLARWYLPQTGAPLWRKQAIADVGGWKEDQPCCQEHELYLRLLIAGKRFRYCGASGAVYRQWSEATVCRRDMPEVHRQRLIIEQRLEGHLRQNGLLTAERLTAINQARFEIARMAWRYDQNAASDVVATIRQSQPDFRPKGDAAPAAYRLMLSLVGFRITEKIANWSRNGRLALTGGAT